MVVTEKEFDFFRDWAIRHAAISLDKDKDYLIRTRLDPVARKYELGDLTELMEALSVPRPPKELVDETLDAFTTNETLFFRDKRPFELLQAKLLPDLIKRNASSRRLRIWSAACSTGQEVYSLAMLIRTHFPELLSWDLEMLATDVSPTVLEKAKTGLYTQMEVGRGLEETYKDRFFSEETSGRYRISESLRGMIDFKRLNFIEAWPDLGSFDIVLIRNVLIYFEPEVKLSILNRIKKHLSPEGYLLLGTAETTINIDPSWQVKREGQSTYFTL